MRPKLYGADSVPEGGALFVGNHTIYGFLDLPFMMSALWSERGIVLRGLGEHGHYAIPVWRNLLETCGMVRGTRDNVRALMREREDILVFPGGAREVLKRRDERYRLIWKERLGFARLPIEFGYPIVPFAAVGAEEMLDVVADAETPVVAQVSQVTQRLVGVPLPPIVHGLGPTPIRRPERLYFWFGEPIDTARFGGEATDASARVLRDEVRDSVESGIAFLHEQRERDPKRHLLPRLRGTGAPAPALDAPQAALVRAASDAWNERGPAALAPFLSPWVVLEDPPNWPDRSEWRGRESALARLDEVTRAFGGRWVETTRVGGSDEDLVVALNLHAGDSAAAPVATSLRLEGTVELGEITQIRAFVDRADQ